MSLAARAARLEDALAARPRLGWWGAVLLLQLQQHAKVGRELLKGQADGVARPRDRDGLRLVWLARGGGGLRGVSMDVLCLAVQLVIAAVAGVGEALTPGTAEATAQRRHRAHGGEGTWRALTDTGPKLPSTGMRAPSLFKKVCSARDVCEPQLPSTATRPPWAFRKRCSAFVE